MTSNPGPLFNYAKGRGGEGGQIKAEAVEANFFSIPAANSAEADIVVVLFVQTVRMKSVVFV